MSEKEIIPLLEAITTGILHYTPEDPTQFVQDAICYLKRHPETTISWDMFIKRHPAKPDSGPPSISTPTLDDPLEDVLQD